MILFILLCILLMLCYLKQLIELFLITKKKEVIVIGGVAASKSLAGMLKKLCKQNKVKLYIPPMVVCLDNGVIIADLGLKYYLHNKTQTLEETVSNAKFRTDQAVVYW